MERREYYGQIQCVENRFAARIWRSRNEEIPDCEPFGMSSDYEVDPWRLVHEKEFLRKVMENTFLTPREMRVIDERFFSDQTLDEIAHRHDITRERVRQILEKALRKLRIVASREFKHEHA
jgi:RNA polymerase sigma factor (sigma-70 family)